MGIIVLNEDEYYDKIYGGWMGKNIGGTLGGPVEGKKQLLDLTFYPKLSDGPMPNDDLDLQLVWLHAIEEYGARLTAKELGQEWMEHVFFPFDEYGYALSNLRRGLVPPVTGWYNNPFTNCMGSPIRSEIWGMIVPGAPGIASYYAYQDAIVDHAGGEGVFGEVFFAAIESAAFFESDVNRLLDIGLSYIPKECCTAKAVCDLRRWHAEGRDWKEARNLILQYHGHSNFTDAPQNIAFTILGWLYGEDFGDAILKAVNCGYDTDCTGATLGAILGIIGGAESLPSKWVKPVGDSISVSPAVKGFPAPKDLHELVQRTIKVAKEVIAAWDIPICIIHDHETSFSAGDISKLKEIKPGYDVCNLLNNNVRLDKRFIPKGSIYAPALEVLIDYGEYGPAIGKNQSKQIIFTIINTSYEEWKGMLELGIPDGWKGKRLEDFKLAPGQQIVWGVEIESDSKLQSSYLLTLSIHRIHDKHIWNTSIVQFALVAATHWTVWGPDDVHGKELICSGNRVEFERVLDTSSKGIYRARTKLINPSDRKIRLIAATSLPAKMCLNDKVLFQDDSEALFMPAYHRAPASRRHELDLPAGEYWLEIEVTGQGNPMELFVLPVATKQNEKPGHCYYFTDMLFA